MLKRFLTLAGAAAMLASLAPAEAQYYQDHIPLGQNALTIPVRSMADMRYQGMVRQSQDLSCGAAAAATILNNVYNIPVSEAEIIEAMLKMAPEADRDRISEEGFSLLELKRFMEQLGFVVGGFKVPDVEALDKLTVPVIALVNVRGYNHFVVIKKKAGDRILIADPAFGNTRPTLDEFRSQWNGVILVVVHPNQAPNPQFLKDPAIRARPLDLLSIQMALGAADALLPGEY